MSTHKKNTEGMHKALHEKRNVIVRRINKLLDELSHQDHPITFSNIAKLGGVSKAWLYRHLEIRRRIDELRIAKNNSLSCQLISGAENTIVSTLRNRIKKLEAENSQLRKQLEIVYGELHVKNK